MAKVTNRNDVPGSEPPLHPRETTGRPPTVADFSPSGKRLAETTFRDIATNPHSQALAAAGNATERLTNWEGENPGKEHNLYAKGEARRAAQMTAGAELVSDRSRPVTMNVAAKRVADNYARAGARTMSGDIGFTEADLGASSLSPSAIASVKAVKAGKGTVTPMGADWYQGHGRELAKIAEVTGTDTRDLVVGSSSMSPQNEPSQERAAATAIAYGQHGQGDRSLTLSKLPKGADKATLKSHAMAMEDLNMGPGETRNFSDFSPDQVAHLARHRDHLSGNVDLKSIAKGGTEVASGTEAIRGQRGQEEFGETGKVPTYTHQNLLGAGLSSLGEAAPDANDWSEFHRRVHESIPGSHPYFEQDTLFGKEWEADPYGKAHVTTGILNPGHQPDAPHRPSMAAEQFYPEQSAEYNRQADAGDIPLHEGTSAQDTWAMAQSLALPRNVEGAKIGESARSPQLLAKALGSDPTAVKIGGGDVFMPTPKGERKLSPSEAQHAVFNEVNNRAAAEVTGRARAAGRNVGAGVPAVAVQAASWTSYRMDMEKDPDKARRESHITAEAAGRPAAPAGVTPKAGMDVPLFGDTGEATRYASNWRSLKSKPDTSPAAPLFPQKTPAEHATDHATSIHLRGRQALSDAANTAQQTEWQGSINEARARAR